MKQYFRSIWLWLTGWFRFDELSFKPGWKADWRWWLLYLVDYGIAVFMLGIGVRTISQWAYNRRDQKPWGWLNNALDALDKDHGKYAGGLIWGSSPAPMHVRYIVIGLWIILIGYWSL